MEYKIEVDVKDHTFCERLKMDRFRKEGRFCDFIIKVELTELPVHQVVISSHSDFFDKMLLHDTLEKQNGFVELKGVDRECTMKCVDFMYTGETSVMEDKCLDLMHAATMYQLTPLCNAIADILIKNLDSGSFFAAKKLADMFRNQKLVDICKEFALRNFRKIIQDEQFGDLDEECVKFVLESENEVSEGDKCKSLIKWVKHDSETRQTSLEGLLSLLDLTKVPLSYRSYLIECEPVVNSSNECMKIVMMSVFQGLNVKSKNLQYLRSEHGIGVFDKTSGMLQVLDVDDRTWTTKQAFNLSPMGGGFSAVVLDEYLYVFGQNKTVFRTAHKNPAAQWERRANKQLYYGDAVTLNGLIYTSDYGNYSQHLERYSPIADRWDFVPKKRMNVHGATLAISEGKIFCIGGHDGNVRKEVEVFDPATSNWNYDNLLNNGKYRCSATTYKDGIYVMGGYSSSSVKLQEVEYRCPLAKCWITLKSMNFARGWFGSCCIEGKIFAIGGDQNSPQTIEQYDTVMKEWKVLLSMTGKSILQQASIIIPT